MWLLACEKSSKASVIQAKEVLVRPPGESLCWVLGPEGCGERNNSLEGKGPGSHRLWGMAEGLEVFILSRLGGGGVGSPEICRTVVWSTKQMCSVYSGGLGSMGNNREGFCYG